MYQLRLCAVFFTVVFALHIVIGKRKGISDHRGFFECLMAQWCLCENAGGIGYCYDLMFNETRQHIADNINACGLGVELSTQMSGLRIAQEICKFNREEWEICYEKGVINQFEQYIREIAKDIRNIKVSLAIEAARNCIAPNIFRCKIFGTDTC